jgi:hypothetical protein
MENENCEKRITITIPRGKKLCWTAYCRTCGAPVQATDPWTLTHGLSIEDAVNHRELNPDHEVLVGYKFIREDKNVHN